MEIQPAEITWPECLDLKKAATYSGLNYWFLRDLVACGIIPRVKLRDPYDPQRTLRRIYVRRIDLDQYIEKSRTLIRTPFEESAKQINPKTVRAKRRKQKEEKHG